MSGLATHARSVERRAWPPDRLLAAGVAAIGAALTVAIVALLFGGVVARYVLRYPLVWSDELNSFLFLWLAMLGAALATYRMSHMRMTVLARRPDPGWSAFFDALALAAALVFLVAMTGPAWQYAREEAALTTSSLELSLAWRAAAVPAGFLLMTVFGLCHLVRLLREPRAVAALLLVGAVVLLFMHLGPMLADAGYLNLWIYFVGVVALCVLLGVPIAFSFGLATLGYLAFTTHVPLMTLVGRMDEGMSHLMLLAVPTFIFLGLLLEMTGMARAMVQFLAALVGHVRGGLSYVLIGAMYLVSGISGSKAADMAAIAPALLPELGRHGETKGELVALLAATGAQTETVPPSIVLITIGSVAGVSIAALFTGGLLPSFVLGLGLCAVVAWRQRHRPAGPGARAGWREVGRRFVAALPALALPFVIRGAVVEGIATATEVSTVGIFYAAAVGLLLYRTFDWRRIGGLLVETVALSGSILIIIGAASATAWALTQSGFSNDLASAMATLPGGAWSFMGLSVLLFVVLGSVLEGVPAIVLFAPLLLPIARDLGIHEVHYAMVIVLSMGLGLFAPPFGVGYYTACAIGKASPGEAMKPIWGYLFALLAGLAVVVAFPSLSTGLLKP
jgi:tripartite ATP-independent transporter DctM subunit